MISCNALKIRADRHLSVLFYLLFGLFGALHCSTVYSEAIYDLANIQGWADGGIEAVYVYHGYFDSGPAAETAIIEAINETVTQYNIYVDGVQVCYGKAKGLWDSGVYYWHYVLYAVKPGFVDLVFDSSTAPVDSDNDGLLDVYDLKPDSSDPYKAAIVSVCYDANNKVVAGVIQDGEGNKYSFGTMPTDFEGYTIDSVSGDLVTYQTAEDLATSLEKLNIDDLNITNKSTPVEIQDDGTIIPGSTDPFKDYDNAEDEQTKAPEPDTQEAPPSEQPDTNDGDSDRFDKIIKNTASTNTNLNNIQKYLGVSNDLLAKINKNVKDVESGGGALVIGSGTETTPTADEIGQAVNDNLIDSGQTIDTTITDNLSALDETDTLTATQTKYSDRYDLFITTLKESDLFSLPFGIFTGPSGSGASIQTVNIGKWGSSNERTATIDYSDYDNIWNILRSVLLLLTSFSCFKILVLKKG